MKRLWVILVSAGIALAVVIAVSVWPGEREPVYQGKKLSEWLDMYGGHHGESSNTEMEEAGAAIRYIGTNALPTMLKWIHCERTRGSLELNSAIDRLPGRLSDSDFLHSVATSKAEKRANAAVLAFEILGAQAAPAIPYLAELTRDTRFPDTAATATGALARIGDNALPALEAASTNGMKKVRFSAVLSFYCYRQSSNSTVAARALVRRLNDADPEVSNLAAGVLAAFQRDADIVVPALTNSLQSASGVRRTMALYSLSHFGKEARSAVPAVLPLLRDPGATTRRGATNALREIAPELLRTDALSGQ